MQHKIAGIVLAAGQATRMGRQKLMLPFRGEPLASHTLRAAIQGGCDPIILVLGRESEAIQAQLSIALLEAVTSIVNKEYKRGQAGSLQTGLAMLPPKVDGVLVLLGDQPLIGAPLVRQLLTQARKTPSAFLVPRYRGQRGNPVYIPAAWFPQVMALSGDTGARPLLTHPGADVIHLDVDDPAVITDIDTPEDYGQLRDA